MQDVIDPDDIHTSFKDIAGIDGIKQELQDMIILPLSQPQLFVKHSLFSVSYTHLTLPTILRV